MNLASRYLGKAYTPGVPEDGRVRPGVGAEASVPARVPGRGDLRPYRASPDQPMFYGNEFNIGRIISSRSEITDGPQTRLLSPAAEAQ
jgi:hypothetical protein